MISTSIKVTPETNDRLGSGHRVSVTTEHICFLLSFLPTLVVDKAKSVGEEFSWLIASICMGECWRTRLERKDRIHLNGSVICRAVIGAPGFGHDTLDRTWKHDATQTGVVGSRRTRGAGGCGRSPRSWLYTRGTVRTSPSHSSSSANPW